ncbi:MAG: hypothetical protein AAGA58_07380 [Verrucomicrobiota bacterium]
MKKVQAPTAPQPEIKNRSALLGDPVLASIYRSVGIDLETIVYNYLNQPRGLVKAQAMPESFV